MSDRPFSRAGALTAAMALLLAAAAVAQGQSPGGTAVAQAAPSERLSATSRRVGTLGSDVKALLRDIDQLRRQKPVQPAIGGKIGDVAHNSRFIAWRGRLTTLMGGLERLQTEVDRQAVKLTAIQSLDLTAAERDWLAQATRDLWAMKSDLSAARQRP